MSVENSTQVRYWMFTEESLNEKRKSVSICPLISEEEEDLIRFFMIKRLISKGTKIGFDRRALVTAIIYLQRYLLSKPVNENQIDEVIAGCLFLASKSEERHYSPKIIENCFSFNDNQLADAEVVVFSSINFHLFVWQVEEAFRGCLLDLVV